MDTLYIENSIRNFVLKFNQRNFLSYQRGIVTQSSSEPKEAPMQTIGYTTSIPNEPTQPLNT